MGPEVERFEKAFAAYLGGDVAAVGVASGTDALEIALRAVGVRAGNLVATVANTAVATVAAIRRIGAIPLFVDIDPDTCLMSPERLEAALRFSPDVRAVVPVHLYGQPAPIASIVAIAKAIPVVEDCAQAHGATFEGRSVGTFGKAAAYSFYPTKPLGACGDGGAVVSRHPEIVRFARLYREYGMDQPQVASIEGMNSRLDSFQAAILVDRLKDLDLKLAERRRLAGLYDQVLLGSPARAVAKDPRTNPSHYVYVVRVPSRDRLAERLALRGIEARVHYPVPIHLMPAYEELGCRRGELPETERACGEVLSLPFWVGMSDQEVREVARELRAALS
jgi:dTDP-4-amino-4,6-dideoxygalactose transaminase